MRAKLHTIVFYNSHLCCTTQKNAHPGTFVTHQEPPLIAYWWPLTTTCTHVLLEKKTTCQDSIMHTFKTSSKSLPFLCP